MKTCIWILEDDAGLQALYRELLADDFSVEILGSLQELKTKLEHSTTLPALVVADLRLPDGNFLDSAPQILSTKLPGCALMIVSTEEDSAILHECLGGLGAEYLVKPFSNTEFRVKIERLLRRAEADRFLTFDAVRLVVAHQGQVSPPLTSKEYQILSLLYQSEQHSASRTQMLQHIWEGSRVGPKTVDVHLFHLRKKLATLGIQISYREPETFFLHKSSLADTARAS